MAYGQRLKEMQKKRRSTKQRFLRTRMWTSTLLASLFRDRGSIPPNIANNIFIGNNMYITKNSITSMIVIREMSTDTPVGVMSDLLEYVKTRVPGVRVDWTMRNSRYYVDTKGADIVNRYKTWKRTAENPAATEQQKERMGRLLYSYDIFRSKDPIYKARIFIYVRAGNGQDLSSGLDACSSYLDQIGAEYKIIKSNLGNYLDYAWLMSSKKSKRLKDIPANIVSAQTLSEMLPSTQGMNDSTGTLMGINRRSMSPYLVNFRASAKAKNILVGSLSGTGKTVLAQNWFIDMYADGYNMSIMDVKGTEFIAFTKAAGGIVVSMRPESTYYVDTFTLNPEESNGNPRLYYDKRFSLSKRKMLLLCDLKPEQQSLGEALLEEFLHNLYLQQGVLAENENTWYRTDSLNPYAVFDAFERFVSKDVKEKYIDVADYMLTRLRIYMSRNGSSSHIFRDPLDYHSILETKVLTFDFGLLESGTTYDPVLFKIRVMDMSLLNDEFISYKAKNHEWTGKVLEEAGIVEDYLMDTYAKEFMLRRAQNQVTILLGNSISALVNNPHAKGILENTNILVVGQLHKTSREYLIEEFGLEDYVEDLENIHNNPDMENTFLLINRMNKEGAPALLKTYVPKKVLQGRLFKIVDTEDE